MPTFSLQITGLTEFTQQLQAASSQVKSLLNTAMSQSVNEIKNDAQDLAPFRTGTLRRSIYTAIIDGGMTGIIGQDSNIAPYGKAIEFGTVGMTINVPNGRRTKNGRSKPYSFIGNIKPNPYLGPAFDKNILTVQLRFQEAVGKILAIAAGQA